MPKRLVLCITGASGAIYAKHFLETALDLDLKVDCIVSNNAKGVISYELGIPFEDFKNKFTSLGVHFHDAKNFFSPLASGSYLKRWVGAVVVLPCSVGTLGAVAGGVINNLIHRVCDAAIKEDVKLIMAIREMPLNAIHLENMLKLQRLGVKAFPISPAFYSKPKTLDELVNFTVGKIFDLLGIEHNLYKRWKGI